MASELRVDRIIPVNGVPTGGGGGIIQIVQGTTTSRATISSSTFTNTNLSASITPTSASNKILIQVHTSVYVDSAADACYLDLQRGTTSNLSGRDNGFLSYNDDSLRFFGASFNYLDSPATTSSVTYTLQARSYVNGQNSLIGDNGLDVIILMEVSG